MPLPCFHDYYSFLGSFEIKSMSLLYFSFSGFFSLARERRTLLSSLHFHMDFRISLSISAKKPAGIFIYILFSSVL